MSKMKINSEYENLDFRINILYDAVYNKESTSKYNLKPIVKNNISLIDIKEPTSFDFSHVFDGQIKFIDKKNNKWEFKRSSSSSHPCSLLIGKYDGGGNINDLSRKELYNPAVHYILSEIALNENFKHSLLPLMFFDITPNELKEKSMTIYDIIKNEIDDMTRLYVFVVEHYFKTETLREYLEHEGTNMTILKYKVLIFQILFALFKISERYQKFRHNMLNLDSIRIYRKKEGDPTEYKIGVTTFSVPNVGFDIKLSDFDLGFTSDYIKNKDTINENENPYYDIHYFISSLYLFLEKKNMITDELKSFIDEIVPSKYLPIIDQPFDGLNEKEFDATTSQIILPSTILRKNNFFKEFITNDMDLSVSPIQNERIKIRELGKKEKDIDYISPTENSVDELRMLGKKVSKNKKKMNPYYNKNMMKGSRRIIMPSYDSVSSVSESGIFEKAETRIARSKKSKKNKKTSSERGLFNKSDVAHMRKQLENKINEDTFVLSDSTVASDSELLKKAMRELGKKHKQSRHSEKHKDDSSSDSSTSRSSTSSPDKKSKKSSSSSSSESKSKSSSDDMNPSKLTQNLSKINKEFGRKLKNVPKNFFGELPETYHYGLPSLDGSQTMNNGMMDQMPMMPPMGQMPMGQMPMGQMPMMQPMAQPMPPMGQMPQGMPSQIPGLMNAPMGGQSAIPGLMNGPMMGQQMDQFNSMNMGGLPMLPQMGGGSKYQPVKNGKVADNLDGKKDFFF